MQGGGGTALVQGGGGARRRIALSPRSSELAREVPGTVSGPPRSTEVSRSRLVAHRYSDLRVLR